MNGSNRITQEQIFEAADRIVASGRNQTYKLIREDLKSGSFPTLSIHLAEWKRQKSEQTTVPQAPSDFQFGLQKIWSAAYREAEKSFSVGKVEFENRQNKWNNQEAELLSVIQKLEQDQEVQVAHFNQKQEELNQINQKLRISENELIRVNTLLDAVRSTEIRGGKTSRSIGSSA